MMLSDVAMGIIVGVRSLIGIVVRPYETYRRIINRASLWELVPVGALLALYFAVASVVKTAAFRPYLLTRRFIVLALAAAISYTVAVIVWRIAGNIVGGRGGLKALAVGWAYTLIPTLLWFLSTSILYVVIPPPRTESIPGLAFSFLYIVFSTVLLFWKIMLSYLVLRFALKLELQRILAACAIAVPVLCAYSVLMYKAGVFRIPFL